MATAKIRKKSLSHEAARLQAILGKLYPGENGGISYTHLATEVSKVLGRQVSRAVLYNMAHRIPRAELRRTEVWDAFFTVTGITDEQIFGADTPASPAKPPATVHAKLQADWLQHAEELARLGAVMGEAAATDWLAKARAWHAAYETLKGSR